MSAGSNNDAVAGEALSALIDGEADGHAVVRACAVWRESATTRSEWHAFHLIGDVMRSEDLASPPARDAAFLARLRVRMAAEPVVLAPAPLVQGASASPALRRRRSWAGPVAVAAGFVAVAGVLVVMRATAPVAAETAIAAAAPTAPAVGPAPLAPAVAPAQVLATAVPAPVAEAAESESLVRNGKVLRDARLDRYLAAHKQFAGSSALGVPSSFLRSATVDATNR